MEIMTDSELWHSRLLEAYSGLTDALDCTWRMLGLTHLSPRQCIQNDARACYDTFNDRPLTGPHPALYGCMMG